MVRLNGKEMNRRLEELLKRTATPQFATVVDAPQKPFTLLSGGQSFDHS